MLSGELLLFSLPSANIVSGTRAERRKSGPPFDWRLAEWTTPGATIHVDQPQRLLLIPFSQSMHKNKAKTKKELVCVPFFASDHLVFYTAICGQTTINLRSNSNLQISNCPSSRHVLSSLHIIKMLVINGFLPHSTTRIIPLTPCLSKGAQKTQ